jgi:electron transfer flavoprotein alpha subunit
VWLVLPRSQSGTWTRDERALCSAAQNLARIEAASRGADGAPFEILCLGGAPTSEDRLPLDARVRVVELPLSLERISPGQLVGLIATQTRAARRLLLPHDYRGFELLVPLAYRLGGHAVPEVVGWRHLDGRLHLDRPCYGGRLETTVALPDLETVVVLSVRPDSRGEPAWSEELWCPREANEGTVASSRNGCAVTLEPAERDWRGAEERQGHGVDLTAAARIVAVGRGLGDPGRLGPLRRLAEVLDAELAGSRPVIDMGWLPEDRQVGSSGQTVAPRLYLALGISGAAQHLAGMSAAHCIVAINQDADAPIFRRARYGIVGDLNALVPELIAAVLAARSAESGGVGG